MIVTQWVTLNMHWKKSSIKSLASNLNEGEFRKIHYLVNIHRHILFYKRMNKPKESTNFVSRGHKRNCIHGKYHYSIMKNHTFQPSRLTIWFCFYIKSRSYQ